MRTARDITQFDHSDPAALIARALHKKFAAQKRVEHSPVSETGSSPGNRSACWSPNSSNDVVQTPLVSGVSCCFACNRSYSDTLYSETRFKQSNLVLIFPNAFVC
jgi:hypothetical protein